MSELPAKLTLRPRRSLSREVGPFSKAKADEALDLEPLSPDSRQPAASGINTQKYEFPLWHSGLRIWWCCCSCGIGHRCLQLWLGFNPCPGTSICHDVSKKEKKRKKKKTRSNEALQKTQHFNNVYSYRKMLLKSRAVHSRCKRSLNKKYRERDNLK